MKPTTYNDLPTLEEINARIKEGKKTKYVYIPTIDEYKVLMEDRRKENTINLKPKNVLINHASILPYKA
jgi:hypothetical protein